MSREVKIGILALVTILASVWGFAFLKGRNLLTNSHTFYAKYYDVGQLPMSAPVLTSGYQIGTVSDIQLDPTDMKTVIVELDIQRKYKIPNDAVAKLVSTGLLGGKAIELIVTRPCTGEDCAQSGDFFESRVAGPLDALLGSSGAGASPSGLGKTLSSAFDSLNQRLNDTTNQGRITSILYNIDLMTASMATTSDNLNGLIDQTNRNLHGMSQGLDAVIGNLEANNETISQILNNAAGLTAQLNEADLKGAVDGMAKMTQSADKSLQSLDLTIQNLDQTLVSFREIASTIQQGEGTLGKLVHEKDLYDNLNKMVRNLELLLQDLRLNPKRYVNVSVFGKKQKEYDLPEDDPAYEEE